MANPEPRRIVSPWRGKKKEATRRTSQERQKELVRHTLLHDFEVQQAGQGTTVSEARSLAFASCTLSCSAVARQRSSIVIHIWRVNALSISAGATASLLLCPRSHYEHLRGGESWKVVIFRERHKW